MFVPRWWCVEDGMCMQEISYVGLRFAFTDSSLSGFENQIVVTFFLKLVCLLHDYSLMVQIIAHSHIPFFFTIWFHARTSSMLVCTGGCLLPQDSDHEPSGLCVTIFITH
jgi:hypothetical protein